MKSRADDIRNQINLDNEMNADERKAFKDGYDHLMKDFINDETAKSKTDDEFKECATKMESLKDIHRTTCKVLDMRG